MRRSLAHGGKGQGVQVTVGEEARNLNPCRWPTLAALLLFVWSGLPTSRVQGLGSGIGPKEGDPGKLSEGRERLPSIHP